MAQHSAYTGPTGCNSKCINPFAQEQQNNNGNQIANPFVQPQRDVDTLVIKLYKDIMAAMMQVIDDADKIAKCVKKQDER